MERFQCFKISFSASLILFIFVVKQIQTVNVSISAGDVRFTSQLQTTAWNEYEFTEEGNYTNNNSTITIGALDTTLDYETRQQINYYNNIATNIWKVWSPFLLGRKADFYFHGRW